MKRNLYLPLFTLGLSLALAAAVPAQAEAHRGRTQRIAAPQSGSYGHHTSIHVNESDHHDCNYADCSYPGCYYNQAPARGVSQQINADSLPVSAHAAGSANDSQSYITDSKARSIALEHAGVKESDLIYLNCHLDYDDGTAAYEIEFCTGSQQYDYEINARDGAILSYDHEIEGGHHHTISGNSITPPEGYISETDAASAALTHAGVKASDVSYSKISLEYEDGVLVYDVEFYAGDKEYDYEINAATAAVLSYDYEIESAPQNTASGQAAVSEAGARKLVLAKIPGASESNIRKFETDHEDGRLIYEGEVSYNGMEYEFEIDSATGVFLDWDVEEDD